MPFESAEQVRLPDVDWQGIPQLGTSLGKAAVSKGSKDKWARRYKQKAY